MSNRGLRRWLVRARGVALGQESLVAKAQMAFTSLYMTLGLLGGASEW